MHSDDRQPLHRHAGETGNTRTLADAADCAKAVHYRPASVGFDDEYFRSIYRDAAYFSCGRGWSDYEPAYRYGYATHAAYDGRRFEDVEDELARCWPILQPDSRLQWIEARSAVRDAWQHIDADPAAPVPRENVAPPH